MIDLSSLSAHYLTGLLDVSVKTLALALLASVWLGMGWTWNPNAKYGEWAVAPCSSPERHDVAITSLGVAGSEEPSSFTGRFTRRFRAVMGGNTRMTIVIAMALAGLTRFASHVTRQAQECESAVNGELKIIVRQEVLRLWLRQPLTELAKSQTWSRFARTHEEMRRYLERRHQRDQWYALTIRSYQPNGEFDDITYVRHPYYDIIHFHEWLDILAMAVGNPPYHPTWDFSRASVYVIKDEYLDREPREVMVELLGFSAQTADQVRSP
jgi:hypothetical protein